MFGNDLFKDDISVEQNLINQNLFEDQQQQLEETVERLAKLVEVPLVLHTNDSHVREMRLQVINLTHLTDTLCRRMYGPFLTLCPSLVFNAWLNASGMLNSCNIFTKSFAPSL
jgi:hypothetical protein